MIETVEPEPLDWARIIADFEAKRREKASRGLPGKTVLVVDEAKPGQAGRPPRVWVRNELPDARK